MSDQKSEGVLIPIDLIRAIAIVMVILLHAAGEPHLVIDIMAPEEMTRWWASNFYESLASPCIALFVMLAGVLLLRPSRLDEPLGVFFKKRWQRIGLPCIFWGIIYFAWRFLVNGEAVTAGSILQGILGGPYVHFWFVYLLTGLFLVTPVLRVFVAHTNWKTLKYLMLLWLVGTTITYILTLFEPLVLNANFFLLTGWLGYFVMGTGLLRVRLRRSILCTMLVLGYLWTILGTYLVVGTMGERFSRYFYDSFSFNVIVVSVALFLLLSSLSFQNVKNRFPRGNRMICLISQNTLPIYLLHMLVLETFHKGYLGFKISITTMNPLLEIPFITVITLFICLGLIITLKKIPYLDRIIG
jgi:surface polysaccharide O-acyltransferase-like enzyme